MRKVFKENGTLQVCFAEGQTDQIKEWLGDIDLGHAFNFSFKRPDPVFGYAIVFPAELVEDEIPEINIMGKTKQDIFENGTNDYCSPIHAAQMYADGNCPKSSVESAMDSAMDSFADAKIDAAIWVIKQAYSKGPEYLCQEIEKLKSK